MGWVGSGHTKWTHGQLWHTNKLNLKRNKIPLREIIIIGISHASDTLIFNSKKYFSCAKLDSVKNKNGMYSNFSNYCSQIRDCNNSNLCGKSTLKNTLLTDPDPKNIMDIKSYEWAKGV